MNGETKALIPGLKHSVENLAHLYSMAAALSLYVAISQLIDPRGEGMPIRLAAIPFLGAFIVTCIPFYQKTLHHLYELQAEDMPANTLRGASLGDIVLLFVKGGLFIALATLLTKPRYFAWTLVTLLALDAVWGILAHLTSSRHANSRTKAVGAWINFFTLILTTLFLLISPSWGLQDKILGWCLFLIALSRTVLEYGTCRNPSFPAGEAEIPCPSPITSEISKDYSLPIPSPSQGQPHRERRAGRV